VMISIPVERPSKKVPVTIQTSGSLPDGYQIKSMTTIDEIDIFGKRDVLENIGELTTKEINLSQLTKSEEIEVELEVPENVAVNDDKVTVKIDLQLEKTFEKNSIEINGSDDAEITFVSPSNGEIDITAIGSVETIRALQKEDIVAKIDAEGLDEGEHDVDVILEGPNDVELKATNKQVRINVQMLE